jgi:hypothetical protein
LAAPGAAAVDRAGVATEDDAPVAGDGGAEDGEVTDEDDGAGVVTVAS